MGNKKVTKTDLHIEYLTERYCDFSSKLFKIEKRDIPDNQVEELQSKIRDLVEKYGEDLRLVVKNKYREGYMRKGLGKNTNRKVKFIENVIKNGIEIPQEATYFELGVFPAILVPSLGLGKNGKKAKSEVKVVNRNLMNIIVYMDEATKDRQKVRTGKGEHHELNQDNPNEYVWNDFYTDLVRLEGEELTK